MSRLFVFDMDGTLLTNTTALLEIAKISGHSRELEALESKYLSREITNGEFASCVYALWKDLTPDIVEQAFQKTPKLKNIKPTMEKIAASNGKACLITAAPDFFADHFYEYGFDHIIASKPFNLQSRVFTPEGVMYAKDKPRHAAKLCEKLNLPFEDTVAFGDSISDVPLFESLNNTVAVNGDEYIKSYAKYHYQGSDLLEALELFEKSQC